MEKLKLVYSCLALICAYPNYCALLLFALSLQIEPNMKAISSLLLKSRGIPWEEILLLPDHVIKNRFIHLRIEFISAVCL